MKATKERAEFQLNRAMDAMRKLAKIKGLNDTQINAISEALHGEADRVFQAHASGSKAPQISLPE